MLLVPLLTGLLAIIVSAILSHKVHMQSPGNAKMASLSQKIHDGALTFLHHEYKIMFDFAAIVFLVLGFALNFSIAIAFLFGFLLSVTAGNIGMRISTKANARTAEACNHSENRGMLTAFRAGSAIALFVVGIAVVGASLVYYILPDNAVMFGFGFGASFAALFARVGGGIYTKAADIAADFVGKIEHNMPEDDPRNPGVIADNIGDNVGDVAGMGADMFETYIESIVAAIAIATAVASFYMSLILVDYIFNIVAAGVFASIIGVLIVRKHIFESLLAASIVMLVLSGLITMLYSNNMSMFICIAAGLVSGLAIGASSDYYTSYRFKPTRSIAIASESGDAETVTTGLSVGMLSTVLPIVAISATIIISFSLSGLLGICISAIGMLSIVGVVLASDSYGSVADNAAGIAEMTKMPAVAYKRASNLDSFGNTTAAVAKGFDMGTAALTSVALFASFASSAKLGVINILEPTTVVGLMIGGLLPFVFSALTIKAVGKTSSILIDEIRRQFRTKRFDSNKAVAMSTDHAVRQMIMPSLVVIAAPILVGFLLGPAALGAMLAGAVITGFLLALTMTNAGGAWDNAKKYIEAGKLHLKGKDAYKLYRRAHNASITGDTVGDPLKDCSGPSLNILIKLISIVALLVAVLLV